MSDKIALEALQQRGRTPLFNDLVSLYQETQNILRVAEKPSDVKITLSLKQIDLPGRVKEITTKHTGLNLIKVELQESAIPTMYATFVFSDLYESKMDAGEESFRTIFAKINSVYDDRSGKVVKPIPPAIGMGFVMGMSVGLWSIRDNHNEFYFTPEELAAATVHEIGHFDHWSRTLHRPLENIADASDIIDYVKKHPDHDLILHILGKLKVSKSLDKSWKSVLDVTEAYFKNNKENYGPDFVEAMSSLEILVQADIANYSVEFSNVIFTDRGDRVYTMNHDVDAERSADEYAARNGAYMPLVSAVKKFDDLTSVDSMRVLEKIMWRPPALAISLLMKLADKFGPGAEDAGFGYDALLRRLELINQTAKHAFSDQKLPPRVAEELKQQIALTDAYISQYRSSERRRIRLRIKEWKTNVGKFGRVLFAPIHNRLQGDYEQLQNATRDLSRHSLYYLAKK